ncbi:hypothetical protein CDL12_16454 [Handroanthus impetiginosus]|uniref:Uncharacterized protein n=1 Tax=Handroanthus impetiginosus TaxID=429701 RepID=A0A2G9H0B4_9LAMI|nr:hypothetical protein CDL12_16454 [Handroanthus impetiginosus]
MDHHQENSSNGSCRKISDSHDGVGRRRTMALKNFVVKDVNEQADEFIKNFRKQLKIERQESLKRCHETRSKS